MRPTSRRTPSPPLPMRDGTRCPITPSPPIPRVQAQLDRLAALSPGADILGLERITRAARRGSAIRSVRLPPVFHVAGTNGKGSTCAFLRAAIEAAGYTVHVYTSPHLVRFNERIRIAGTLIDDDALAALLAEVLDAGGRHRRRASSRSPPPPPSSPSRAPRPTPASSRSGSAAGSMRPTSSPRPVGHAASPSSASTTGVPRRHARARSPPRRPASPSPACRWSRCTIPRRSRPDRRASRRRPARPWLPRGRDWDATTARGDAALSRRDGFAVDLPLPAPGRRAPGAQPRARGRDAAPPGRAARPRSRAMRAAADWAHWPARLQRLVAGPLHDRLPAGSELWLDGGHNPAAGAPVARALRTHRARVGRCTWSSACSPTRMRRACCASLAPSVDARHRGAGARPRASRPAIARDAGRASSASPPTTARRSAASAATSPRRPTAAGRADRRLALPRRRSAAAERRMPD